MNIAIIGAGFTGLSAAYRLIKKGHSITIFERDTEPGGLALGFKLPNWAWSLEKHYHHWFTNDWNILGLAQELHYPYLIKRPKTSIYVDGAAYQLDSPRTVLTFPKLTLLERLRMAGILSLLKFNPFWQPLEQFKTAQVLPVLMGQRPYEMIWEPQLTSKFGSFSKDISLSWFWARIYKRTSSLAYPQGGFLEFAQHIRNHIEEAGAIVLLETEVQSLGLQHNHITIRAKNKTYTFDRAIVTIPSFLFANMAPQLPKNYILSLTSLKSLGAINLVLRLKQQFITDNTYWLSVCDKNSPVMAIVEHTNFMDSEYYDNEHILYVGNYVPADHRYFKLTRVQLFNVLHPFLEKLHPGYTDEIIDYHVFAVPFAQPVIPANYSKQLPSYQSPLPGVFLANMQQVYPWDRGTNYAVQLGETVANLCTKS